MESQDTRKSGNPYWPASADSEDGLRFCIGLAKRRLRDLDPLSWREKSASSLSAIVSLDEYRLGVMCSDYCCCCSPLAEVMGPSGSSLLFLVVER
jgi:hypothetical protein